MIITFKKIIKILLDVVLAPLEFILVSIPALLYLCVKLLPVSGGRKMPRLMFGSTPIISLQSIANSLKREGFVSDCVVIEKSPIYQRRLFDKVLTPKSAYPKAVAYLLTRIHAAFFLGCAIFKYDIFHYYFDGGLLRRGLLRNFELFLLKILRKKLVLLPYGSDAFVYDKIPSPLWRHGLMTQYADYGNHVKAIEKRLRYFTKKADTVIACLVHFINLPRWDVLPLTCYPIDTGVIKPVNSSTTTKKTIHIAHASNHRGVKGTEFLVNAVNRLAEQGYSVTLDVIEKVDHKEALERISACDIYVDQLVFGYAQAALEGMALAKPVISAIDDSEEYGLFRRYSYLNECPIISANAETIYEVLKDLLNNSDRLTEIGESSRKYVEKRHSLEACSTMYQAIYDRIWWDKEVDLINFFHPLLERQ